MSASASNRKEIGSRFEGEFVQNSMIESRFCFGCHIRAVIGHGNLIGADMIAMGYLLL